MIGWEAPGSSGSDNNPDRPGDGDGNGGPTGGRLPSEAPTAVKNSWVSGLDWQPNSRMGYAVARPIRAAASESQTRQPEPEGLRANIMVGR